MIYCLCDVGALVVGVHARHVDGSEAEAVLFLSDGPVLAMTGKGSRVRHEGKWRVIQLPFEPQWDI